MACARRGRDVEHHRCRRREGVRNKLGTERAVVAIDDFGVHTDLLPITLNGLSERKLRPTIANRELQLEGQLLPTGTVRSLVQELLGLREVERRGVVRLLDELIDEDDPRDLTETLHNGPVQLLAVDRVAQRLS